MIIRGRSHNEIINAVEAASKRIFQKIPESERDVEYIFGYFALVDCATVPSLFSKSKTMSVSDMVFSFYDFKQKLV